MRTRTRIIPTLAVLCATSSGLAAADTEVNRRVPATPGGTVVISNVAGSLTIVGSADPEVVVTGELGKGVERLDLLAEGDRTIVKVVLPKGLRGGQGNADLLVRLPAASRLEVSTVSADIQVDRVTGSQRLQSVSGDVRALGIEGNAEIRSVSGDIEARGRGRPAQVRLSTVSGNAIFSEGAGDLDAVSVSGDLTLEIDRASAVRVRTTSGNLRLRGNLAAAATVDIETVSGDLELSLPASGGLAAEVETFSGDLENCFGAKAEPVGRYGPGERLNVRRGDGGARLRVRTMSGNVSLCDR
jgi:hypothetical protein